MGNDGGSIPSRRELVKEASKGDTNAEIFDKKQLNSDYEWITCKLSSELLCPPIVSDYKGHLFNKSAILEWILDSSKFGQSGIALANHIKSMKDIVELKLDSFSIPVNKLENDKNDLSSQKKITWICPISRKEQNSNNGNKFIYIAECGHVFAQSSLKEIKSNTCLICDTPYEEINLIIINPSSEADILSLENRIQFLNSKGLTHSLSTLKKKKKKKEKHLSDNSSHSSGKITKPKKEKNSLHSISVSSTS